MISASTLQAISGAQQFGNSQGRSRNKRHRNKSHGQQQAGQDSAQQFVAPMGGGNPQYKRGNTQHRSGLTDQWPAILQGDPQKVATYVNGQTQGLRVQSTFGLIITIS